MLPLLFLGILLMAGSSQAETNCSVSIFQSCESYATISSFPRNEDQLNDICESMLKYLECAKTATETCDEHKSKSSKINDQLSVAQDLCNENTSFHRAVADKLYCIRTQYGRPGVCDPPVTIPKMTEYAESLREQGIPHVGQTEESSRMCIILLGMFGCFTSVIGEECGPDAKNGVLAIFQILPTVQCREDITEHLPSIVRLFEGLDERFASPPEVEVNCSMPVFRMCDSNAAFHSFPQNEDQMHVICESGLNFLLCAKNATENCDEHKSESTEVNELLSVAQDICNENSSLHRAVADNLHCVSGRLSERHACEPPDTIPKARGYLESLKDQGVITQVGITEDDSRFCTIHLGLTGCLAATIGKECGASAKNASLEIFQRVLGPVAKCSEDIIGQLPAIAKLFEAVEEETVEETLRKKK